MGTALAENGLLSGDSELDMPLRHETDCGASPHRPHVADLAALPFLRFSECAGWGPDFPARLSASLLLAARQRSRVPLNLRHAG